MAVVDLAEVLRGYSWFLPGLAVSAVAGAATGRWVGRKLGGGWVLGIVLVVALGLVLSATLTPSYEALVQGIEGSGSCDLGRTALPSPDELSWPREALLNVLLFLPLGLVVGSVPTSRARSWLVALALLLPFAIELVQLRLTSLGRECQSADVIDNLIGLAVGFVLATAAGLAGRLVRGKSRGDPAA